MEAWLKGAAVKDLGVAWWLATGLLNQAARRAEEEGGELRAWGEMEASHPLRGEAAHFGRLHLWFKLHVTHG